MKFLVVLATFVGLIVAKSVKYIKLEEVTEGLLNNNRFLIWDTEDGLVRVEDLLGHKTAPSARFSRDSAFTFYVYSPERRLSGQSLKGNQIQNIAKLTTFRVNRPTLVVIHGWTNNYLSEINTMIKDAALDSNNINVIVFDWSTISKSLYTIAQSQVQQVGNYLGDVLLRLSSALNYPIEQFTLAGFSFGAHVAGNAGARTGGRIARIVGMDPAGPLFTRENINNRLDPTDAKFVQVIHTNDGAFGFRINMGHVDFYPNGGASQPGCFLDVAGVCSHNRAYKYYAESMGENRFVSRMCSSYLNYELNQCWANSASFMGGFPVNDRTINGMYFLDTNGDTPYGIN